MSGWGYVPPQIRRAVGEMGEAERAVLEGRDPDARPDPEGFEAALRGQLAILKDEPMTTADFLWLACEADVTAADAYAIMVKTTARVGRSAR